MLKTKEDVLKEVKLQLSKFLLSGEHTIDWLEIESRVESEYPIAKLAENIGYNSTADLLHGEFRDYVKFLGTNLIKAGPKLYDTPELQHIVSLHKRTTGKKTNVLKERNKSHPKGYEDTKRYEIRRPRHIYGDENDAVVIRRRIRIIEEPYHRSGRIQKRKSHIRSTRSSRHISPPPNEYRHDCRVSLTTDLMDNILELTKEYGFGKECGRLTSLHLSNFTVPAIVDWGFMLKKISSITAKHATVTLINDVSPSVLFFDFLNAEYGISNESGETYSDAGKEYSVWTGILKTRKYKIMFLDGR